MKREGKDLTIVATSIMVQRSLAAAEQLAEEGIEVEIVDPRTLRPLDTETIIHSVIKTGRVLIVHEAVKTGGFGGELAGIIAESKAFGYLDAPIVRLAGKDIPIPYNRNLELQRRAAGRRYRGKGARYRAGEGVSMATDVIMPKVDMDQETGTVAQWLKKDGDEVKQGETILEIETDKVAIEVEAPARGILGEHSCRCWRNRAHRHDHRLYLGSRAKRCPTM